MALHPLEQIIISGLPVDKAALKAELKKVAREFDTVAAVRTYDLTGVANILIGGAIWYFDPLDLASADDGVTVIIDFALHRFKPKATGGGGTVQIPTASSVAGTNAITATSNGLTTPSAVAQYVWLTPVNSSTGAVAIIFDAFGSLAVKTPLGAALDANNTLVAGIPYLLRVTNAEIRIQSSGASW